MGLPRAVGRLLPQTLKDLFLIPDPAFSNQEPLVKQMAINPDYLNPLSMFRSRLIFSNMDKDLSVSYRSSAIRSANPYIFRSGVLAPSLRFRSRPCIVAEAELESEAESTLAAAPAYSAPLEEMRVSLDRLGWERYLVVPDRWMLAHEDIVHKNHRKAYALVLQKQIDLIAERLFL